MTKVTLVKTKTCVYCPTASRLWKELGSSYKFDYEEVDAATPKGQQLASKFMIMAVPTSIIEDKNGKTNVIVGVPNRDKAIQAVKG